MRAILTMSVVLLTAAAASAAEPAHVLFKPFTEADNSQQPDWITRALNQSVIDELASMPGISVMTPAGANLQASGAAAPATQPATQPSTPADFTISGTIQRVNQQLRVTGAIANAQEKTVGGFKATGSEQDLFAIEDSIAEQLRSTLGIAEQPPAVALSSGSPGAAQPPASGSYEGSDLQRSVQDPTYTRRLSDRSYYNTTVSSTPGIVVPSYTPGYPSGYYPPYYGGGWGWGWSPSVIIVNPDIDRGHNHHHGNHGNPRPNPNDGQAIRREAVGAGGNISAAPQLVPSGGPQLVPSGGPQLVPGNPVPRGMGGGNSAAPGAGNPAPAHAPGAGYNTNPAPAPGAGHH